MSLQIGIDWFCLFASRESVATLTEFSNYIELVDGGQRVEMERLQTLAGDEVQRQNDVVNATKTSCEEQLMRLQQQFEDVSCVIVRGLEKLLNVGLQEWIQQTPFPCFFEATALHSGQWENYHWISRTPEMRFCLNFHCRWSASVATLCQNSAIGNSPNSKIGIIKNPFSRLSPKWSATFSFLLSQW